MKKKYYIQKSCEISNVDVFNKEYNADLYVADKEEPVLPIVVHVKLRTCSSCSLVFGICSTSSRHQDNVHYPSLKFLRNIQNTGMDVEIIDSQL